MNEFSLIVQSLGWTILHSIWQGLIVFICLSIMLKALDNGHARIKYTLSITSMLVLFLWFVNTWFSNWDHLHAIAIYRAENGFSNSGTILINVPTVQHANIAAFILKIQGYLQPYFPIIVSLYCLGLLSMLLRFGWGVRQIQMLRKKGLAETNETQNILFQRLLNISGITTQVRLFFSENIYVPIVIGSIKPIILLPIASINNLTTEEMDAILLHELAHIIRHDYLMNIFQMVIETILFFNPFTWLLSSHIRREREHCCDDMVIKNTNQPLSYAKALATLESSRTDKHVLAIAATGNKNQLFNRIKRIMEMKKHSPNYSYIAIILIVVALIFSVSHFNAAYAQTKKTKTIKKETSSTVVTKHKVIIIDNNGNRTTYDSEKDVPDNVKKDIKDMGKNDHKTKRIKEVILVNDDNSDGSNATKDVDWNNIQQQMENTFSDTGAFASAMNTVTTAVSNIDLSSVMDAVQQSLDAAQKNLSDPKLKKQVQEELERAKEELEKAKLELGKVKTETKVTVRRDKKNSWGVTMEDIDDYDNMIKKMAADGLLDKDNYTVEKKHGKLYIDGIRQSDEVYKKYQDYFSKNDIIIKNKNTTN